MRLRRATDDDDPFCLALHEQAMREYVEPIYGWDNEVQRAYHAAWFDPDRLSIIEEDDGRRVGVLDVTDEHDHLYLARIEILPRAQGRGLGSAALRDLLRRGRPIRLHVFSNNVRARTFYEEHGFTVDENELREGRVSMRHPGTGSPPEAADG
jgi:ribosomal protein S18 acetylase RimI-like enzyme